MIKKSFIISLVISMLCDVSYAQQSKINYIDIGSALKKVQVTANNAIPQEEKGSANGVAQLDPDKNMINQVQTPGYSWGQSYIAAGLIPAGNGYEEKPHFSANWNNGDVFLYPYTTLIGGHTDHDDGYLKITGSPWSMSDSGGDLLSVFDTVGDQGTGRNGCGNDDGCSLFVGTQITPFRIEAGSEVTRDDGIKRTVSFDGSHVYITPSLSSAQIRLLKTWMRIYTNYDSSSGDNATGGNYWKNWNGEILSTSVFTPNVYYGYISSWSSDTDKTTLNIVSDPDGRSSGWRTENSADTITTAPGSNSGDILDTNSSVPTWTYSTPSVFIGGAYKKFNTNRTVACLPGSNIDTLTRQCEGEEMDLWGSNKVDTTDSVAVAKEKVLTREREIHGLTISYGGYEPADGSYDLALAGGINNMIVMNPMWYASAIQSDPIYVGPLEGPSLDVSNGNTQSVLASFATSTNTGEQTFGPFRYIRPMWYATRFASDGSGTDYTNETISYGISVGGGRGEIGTIQEHIEMNPQVYKNGIGLCGYNTCSYLDSHANYFGGGNISPGAGSSLYTIDPNGSNSAYIHANSTHQMVIDFSPQSGNSNSNSGSEGDLNVLINGGEIISGNLTTNGDINSNDIRMVSGKSLYICASTDKCSYLHGTSNGNMKLSQNSTTFGGGIISGSFTYSTLPTTEDDMTEVTCSDCKLNGVTGVKALWHQADGKWTDYNNNPLSTN